MKFTKIPTNTFKNIQMNAGILVENFTPATGEVEGIIGATTGGINFTATPTFSDFGDDIDNAPKNMKELKKLDSIEAALSGTFVTVTSGLAKKLVGAADIDANDSTHVVPRNDILDSDFNDIWWVGDYSNLNGETNGGYCAIHLMNALSTGGFQIQTTDKAKGTFAFTFTGHYSMSAQTVVPYEIYVKDGAAEPVYTVVTPTFTKVTPVGTENPTNEGWYENDDGVYVDSTDTSVDNEKEYYSNSQNPKTLGWYEKIGTTYTVTTDTRVDGSKTYYEVDD